MGAFENLVEGRILEAVISIYTDIIGVDLFWSIIFMTAIGLIYLKTRDIMLVGVTTMLAGIVMLPVMSPAVQNYIYAIIIIGITMTIYKVYKDR